MRILWRKEVFWGKITARAGREGKNGDREKTGSGHKSTVRRQQIQLFQKQIMRMADMQMANRKRGEREGRFACKRREDKFASLKTKVREIDIHVGMHRNMKKQTREVQQIYMFEEIVDDRHVMTVVEIRDNLIQKEKSSRRARQQVYMFEERGIKRREKCVDRKKKRSQPVRQQVQMRKLSNRKTRGEGVVLELETKIGDIRQQMYMVGEDFPQEKQQIYRIGKSRGEERRDTEQKSMLGKKLGEVVVQERSRQYSKKQKKVQIVKLYKFLYIYIWLHITRNYHLPRYLKSIAKQIS